MIESHTRFLFCILIKNLYILYQFVDYFKIFILTTSILSVSFAEQLLQTRIIATVFLCLTLYELEVDMVSTIFFHLYMQSYYVFFFVWIDVGW